MTDWIIDSAFLTLKCFASGIIPCNTMQTMLKTKKDEEEAPVVAGPSAFHPAGSQLKSLPGTPGGSGVGGLYRSPRDSGYGTDFSPASVTSMTSASRRSTYDNESDLDLTDALEDMDLNRDNDVFSEGCNNPTIFECSDESDETDKEVEGLLNEDSSPRRTVSQPIHIKRPSAPIPTPEDEKMEEGVESDVDADVVPVSDKWVHVNYNLSRERHVQRNRFRPIVSRSVGTQTPSPHSQLIQDAMTSVNAMGRFQPYARGNAVTRLRQRSESEDAGDNAYCRHRRSGAPLPDLVCHMTTRDRSVSLPDVPSFRRREQEQEVGRELRRISDEFNSSFTRVRTGRSGHQHASSFPLVVNIDLGAYWTSLRRILSSSPLLSWRNDPVDDVMFRDTDGSNR